MKPTYSKSVLRAFLALLVLGCTFACQMKERDTSMENAIDGIFSEYNASDKPGAAVAVVHRGEIVFKKGYGSAHLEYDIPVTPETIFHVASVSKQFTVFALLLLAEEGKLSLDDPIQKYVPEVPDFGNEITLRHLATHTSGLRDQWDLLSLAGWRWDDVITTEHILKMVGNQKDLNFDPGEQYTYCNTGFTLLAEVVARVSGKSFADFTKERIFTPLQMRHSQFYDDHTKIVKNRAYSYYPNDEGYQKSVLSYANVGATSLFTTVEDLSLWAMNFEQVKVGSAAIIDQMNTLAVLNNGETFGGAYGQFVGDYKGVLQIQHGGADAGYRSYLGRFPDQDFAVSVVSNSGASNPRALALEVADLYLKDAFESQAEEVPEPPETISLSETELEAFEGHYWDARDLYGRRIHLTDGKLQYDRGNGNTTELAPISKNGFLMQQIPGQVKVTFVSEDGKDRMIVSEGTEILGELDRYLPVATSSIDLAAYVGRYTSSELRTSYTLVLQDGQLVATHPRNSDMSLRLVKMDVFDAEGNTVVFVRNTTDEVVGLEISTGRAKRLAFKKE